MSSKLINKAKGYGKYLSFLAKSKLSRKFKRNENLVVNTLSMSKGLSKYLGAEEEINGSSGFVYHVEDLPNKDTLKITYSDMYGAIDSPNSTIELFRTIDNESVLISRFSPTIDMFLPGFNNNYWGDKLPVGLGGDLDPQYALSALTNYYLDNKERLENEIKDTPKYILERLLGEFPQIMELNGLNRFQGSLLNSKDLKTLKEELSEIGFSDEYNGIKLNKARELATKLCQKYAGIENDLEISQEQENQEEEINKKHQNLEEILQTPKKRKPTNSPGQGIAGYRRDIKINVRSNWEANYARVLMFQGIPFSYEPKTFELEVVEDMKNLFNGKEKISYIPDFQIKDENHFVEIKGEWFNYNAQEAMAKTILFQRKNPDLKLNIIGVQEYKSLERHFKDKIEKSPMFCGWETGGRKQGNNLFTNPKAFG